SRLLRMRRRRRGLRSEARQEEAGVHGEQHGDGDQHVHVYVQLRLTVPVLAQPLQHVVLARATLTSINTGESLAEIDNGRKLSDAPFSGVSRVGHLDERDVQVVRLAVDVLQLLVHFLALFVIVYLQKKTLVHKSLQHPVVHGLDLVCQFAVVVVDQPLENRFFVLIAISEVDESRESFDRVSFRQLWILNLHQMNTENVAFVVDFLQSFQNFIAYMTCLTPTEVYRKVLGLFYRRFQHHSGYQFDSVFSFLRDQPLQNLFLHLLGRLVFDVPVVPVTALLALIFCLTQLAKRSVPCGISRQLLRYLPVPKNPFLAFWSVPVLITPDDTVAVFTITFVHVRYSSLEEYQCRKTVDTVLLSFLQIGDLDERYVMLITIVVDVLQFGEDLLTLLLILIVSRQTFVNDRLLFTEIRECWEVFDTILLGQSFVVDLDEIDPEVVRVVVDLLQFGQHLVACRAASCVCNHISTGSLLSKK
ncbi:hypothetical protein WN55_00469, partial [Dufourea novaeangliae]